MYDAVYNIYRRKIYDKNRMKSYRQEKLYY